MVFQLFVVFIVMHPINTDPSIDAIVDFDACVCNREYALCASLESACVLTRDFPLSVNKARVATACMHFCFSRKTNFSGSFLGW